MKPQVSRESLFNYFAGRATALQKQQIDEWVKEEQNRELFFECLSVWESQNSQFTADVEQALARHQSRMAQQPQPKEELSEDITSDNQVLTAFSWFRWLVAATVSALVVFGGVRYKNNLLYTTYRVAERETRTLTLSDGSRVLLNGNSSLMVPRFGFGQRTRKVILDGEAEFAIKHMPNHQKFIVQTNRNFEVVVLGTEFVVNTHENRQQVTLNTGKVQLLYQEGAENKKLTMKPGNQVTFDRKGHVSLKQDAGKQNFTLSKEHRFVFEETTLEELSVLFRENYGMQLVFPEKQLMQWTVSGAFTANNAEDLIETLTSASNLTYKRQGDSFIISLPLPSQ